MEWVMKVGWCVVWMLATGGLTSCYRSADVPLDGVRRLQSGSDGHSLVLEFDGGGTQRFPEYDAMVVEVESPASGDTAELELGTPLRASLDARSLRLVSVDRTYEVSRPDVQSITLQERAPSRPYIIVGAALGGLLLGGLLGATAVSCHEDEDFCGLGKTFGAGVGSLFGLGGGLAISIPMTSKLPSERSGPRAGESWRPHAD